MSVSSDILAQVNFETLKWRFYLNHCLFRFITLLQWILRCLNIGFIWVTIVSAPFTLTQMNSKTLEQRFRLSHSNEFFIWHIHSRKVYFFLSDSNECFVWYPLLSGIVFAKEKICPCPYLCFFFFVFFYIFKSCAYMILCRNI